MKVTSVRKLSEFTKREIYLDSNCFSFPFSASGSEFQRNKHSCVTLIWKSIDYADNLILGYSIFLIHPMDNVNNILLIWLPDIIKYMNNCDAKFQTLLCYSLHPLIFDLFDYLCDIFLGEIGQTSSDRGSILVLRTSKSK